MVAASTAQAALLSDLLQGGTVEIGDKVFADFTYATACGPDPSQIMVTGWDFGLGAHGTPTFGLQIQGPMVAGGVGNPGICDIGLSYSVTVVPGSPYMIHDLYQAVVVTVIGNGGTLAIGEIVQKGSALGPIIGTSNVGVVGITQDVQDPADEPGDLTLFAPTDWSKKVFVSKDIFMEAADANSLIGATVIYQGFSQVIPEPATWGWMAAVGLLGFGIYRRR
jgi:hypothetical protein